MMLNRHKARPTTIRNHLNYGEYLERYHSLYTNLDNLGILVPSQPKNIMTKAEFELISDKVVASFDFKNMDYSELVKVIFDTNDVPARISHEIIPKTVFFVLNIERYNDKITNALARLSSAIGQTILDRIHYKILPLLTNSANLECCPDAFLVDVRDEKDTLLTELQELLAQDNIRGANQVLAKFDDLVACLDSNNGVQEKIDQFRKWQENQYLSSVGPAFGW